MNRKRWKRTFLIFFSVIFSLIIIAEITLRIVYHEQLDTRIYPLIYQPDTLLGFTYIPGTQAEISQPGIHKKFRINENGFYGPAFSRQKPPGKFRIVVIGASEASGIWLNGEENFCEKFQKKLDERHVNAEVLNFSMDGKMRDLNNVHLIRSRVIDYSPDLILLTAQIPFIDAGYRRATYKGYVINFNGRNKQSELWCKNKIDYIESHRFLIGLYRASYIVRAACRYYMYHYSGYYAYNLSAFVEKRLQAPDIGLLPYSIKRTIDMLKDTEALLHKQHCSLVLYYYNKSSWYEKLLDKYKLRSLFLDVPKDKSMHYALDGHYNDKAQEVIAAQLTAHYDQLYNMTKADSLNKN